MSVKVLLDMPAHPPYPGVKDESIVSTWQGWLYVAFVIDVFARRIVGWRVSSTMATDFVLDALEQALYARQLGYIPPAETEANYCRQRNRQTAVAA
jgi:transposase InsO family protein